MICIKDVKCPVCGGTLKCRGYQLDHVGLDGHNNYIVEYRGKIPCLHNMTVTVTEKDKFLEYVKE